MVMNCQRDGRLPRYQIYFAQVGIESEARRFSDWAILDRGRPGLRAGAATLRQDDCLPPQEANCIYLKTLNVNSIISILAVIFD